MSSGASPGDLQILTAALADPTRRLMMDRLRDTPGLTTGELAALVPAHSRFAAMKHLRVLVRAGLVRAMDDGPRRRHYLEPAALAPLRAWLERIGGSPRRPATR